MTPALILFGLVLGVARAAAPGPASTEAVERGRAGSPGGSFLVQLGALAGELGWASLAFVGLAMMLSDAGLRAVLALGVGVLLAVQGLAILRAAAIGAGERGAGPEADPAPVAPAGGPFATGVRFSGARVVSPLQWAGIGAWLAPSLPVGGEAAGSAIFLAAVTAGWLGWAAGFAGLAARARVRAGSGWLQAIDAAAGLALLGLGVVVLGERLLGG